MLVIYLETIIKHLQTIERLETVKYLGILECNGDIERIPYSIILAPTSSTKLATPLWRLSRQPDIWRQDPLEAGMLILMRNVIPWAFPTHFSQGLLLQCPIQAEAPHTSPRSQSIEIFNKKQRGEVLDS